MFSFVLLYGAIGGTLLLKSGLKFFWGKVTVLNFFKANVASDFSSCIVLYICSFV